MGPVAPGEELYCDLGAESGIEVIYRPMFKSKENASGQKATVSFKQVIDVRNTFQRPVRVMVVDQLPSSGEDKIKVSPVICTFLFWRRGDCSKVPLTSDIICFKLTTYPSSPQG